MQNSEIFTRINRPGKIILNTPGPGRAPCFFEDPEIRLQKWGGNLRHVPGGHPIDIDSDLIGITRPLKRDCVDHNFPKKGTVYSEKAEYCTLKGPFTKQSRVTHPVWMYRDLEQTNYAILPLDPQEHTCVPFANNVSSRILEKDNFKPKIPVLKDEIGNPIN